MVLPFVPVTPVTVTSRDGVQQIDGAALDASSHVSVVSTNGLLHEQVIERIGASPA